MTLSTGSVTLKPLRQAGGSALKDLLDGIAALELLPGQEAFVGDPVAMIEQSLADPARHPFAICAGGPAAGPAAVVGMGVLHIGAATDAGWADPASAVLLRGFLIDHHHQGLGYGREATVAAVVLAGELSRELDLPAEGVVLGVNERNSAGYAAYTKAGFERRGTFLGGRPGPQHIMYRAFVNNR
jgi:RimJ/RimL family protein N-acetyltransferase